MSKYLIRRSHRKLPQLEQEGPVIDGADGEPDAGRVSVSALHGVNNVRNVIANWGSFLLSAVAGLFLSPFVVHSLGASGYGVWVIIGSLTGSLGLLDLGIRSAVTRLVAKAHATAAHDEASRIASTARAMYQVAGLVAVGVTLVLVLGLTSWFNIPPNMEVSSRIVLLVSGLSVAVLLATGLYSGTLAAVQRLDVIGVVNIATELMRVVLVLAVLNMGGGIVGLGAITLLLILIRYRWQAVACARCYPELRLTKVRPDREDIRTILDISIFATLIYSMGTISAQVGVYIMGAILPMSAVAMYAIGATLPSYAQALSLPIAQVVLPQASRMDALGSESGMQDLVLRSGRLGTLALLPVVLAFMTHGPTFIEIWMGREYRETSGKVLVVLSITALFGIARHVIQTVFVGAGKHRHLVPWYVAEAVVTATLSILFVWRWGVIGAAWAVVMPGLVVSILVFPAMLSRHYRMPVRRTILELWIRPLVAMGPYTIACLCAAKYAQTNNYIGFFSQILLLLPIAAVGAYAFGLTKDERARVFEVMVARFGSAVFRAFGGTK